MEVMGFPQVGVAGIIFLVMFASFGVLSVILEHHWNNYEIEDERRRKARRIYYIGAGIILAFMLISFLSFLI